MQEQKLYNLIPDTILEHYARANHLTKIGACAVAILYNPEWAERLLEDEAFFSQEDVMHDFVGIISNDEFL